MSENITDGYLDLLEELLALEDAGVLRRVTRPDGETGWEPTQDQAALDAWLGDYEDETEPGETYPEDDEGFWDETE